MAKAKRVLLTKREIETCLKLHTEWKTGTKDTQLYRSFAFSRHIDALVFIARITVHAELLQHHPDIEFSYCKVKVKLTTHELKGLTKVDVHLLERIEEAFEAPFNSA